MKQKIILIIFGIILISGCTESLKGEIITGTTGLLLHAPIPIYNINHSINSNIEAQYIFNEYINTIINSTKKIITNRPNAHRGIKSYCLENNDILIDNVKFEIKTYQNSTKKNYLFTVYVVEKGAKWKEENENIFMYKKSCTTIIINNTTGEQICNKPIQSWDPAYHLNYILTSEGNIMLDGDIGYCAV